jgi:hypothetical protein
LALTTGETESYRQIESGTFLTQIGGSEINGDALAVGKFKATIAKSGFDPLTAFLDGVVKKADDVEVLHATGANVYLDLDEVGVDTVDGGADGFEEHGEGRIGAGWSIY